MADQEPELDRSDLGVARPMSPVEPEQSSDTRPADVGATLISPNADPILGKIESADPATSDTITGQLRRLENATNEPSDVFKPLARDVAKNISEIKNKPTTLPEDQ